MIVFRAVFGSRENKIKTLADDTFGNVVEGDANYYKKSNLIKTAQEVGKLDKASSRNLFFSLSSLVPAGVLDTLIVTNNVNPISGEVQMEFLAINLISTAFSLFFFKGYTRAHKEATSLYTESIGNAIDQQIENDKK